MNSSPPIAILGAGGLVGRALVAACRAIGRPAVGLSSADVDLCDAAAVENRLPVVCRDRAVVMAAAVPRLRDDSRETMLHNVAMVANVLDVLAAFPPVHLTFVSSVEVYGIPRELPIPEDTPLRPLTLYGVGKAAAELLVQRWHEQTRVPVAILRPPGIFGLHDRGRGLIGAAAAAIRENRVFRVTGNPLCLRDYTWADDLARLILRAPAASAVTPELLLNAAPGQPLSISAILDLLQQQLGAGRFEAHPEVPAVFPGDLVFDTDRQRQLLPEFTWTPLAQAVACYRPSGARGVLP